MKTDIYFNVHVSAYFNVPFYNTDTAILIPSDNILNCPIVSWDIGTRKMLEALEGSDLNLKGIGDGVWIIEGDKPQNKPDTEKWNKAETSEPPRSFMRHWGTHNFMFI